MSSRLNPYFNFTDTARDALTFYQEVFGGDLTLTSFAEFGQADAAVADLIMHGMLTTPSGYTLMASDTPPGMTLGSGSSITVSLSGDDVDELTGYWERLSAEGSVEMALERQMWGDVFGMCTDRFGIAWMVNIAVPED